MRKSTLFLSSVLTTFMLAIMAGAVSAYQKVVKNTDLTAAATSVATEPAASEVAAAPAATTLAPEQAAALAAQVIGRTDLYSVETTDFNGASVYLVTFSSGDLVYVSPDGQILSISKIPPVVVSVPSGPKDGNRDSQGGSSQGSQQQYSEHEDDHSDDGEDHQSEDGGGSDD